ncbi:HDOD domain-containing protein [soil metagenome]
MSICVARQPIFDHHEHLFGYELLYRSDVAAQSAVGPDSNTMSARVIANVFLGMDIRELTGGLRAFVNLTGEQLLDETYALFDARDVVIEVLETCVVNDETVTAVHAMRDRGYTIALDDFEPELSAARLLDCASIIKIDVLNRPDNEILRVVEFVRPFGVRLLAERVETAEVYARCRAMGFELFQGYFHARPVTVHSEDVDARQSTTMSLLNMLRDPDATDASIASAFHSDPALCYKLMRIVNSSAVGTHETSSVQQALRLVGRSTLYRWLSILFTASFADGSDSARELVVGALARGQLSELVAMRTGGARAADAMFLTGVLSRMDALMRLPMERVLAAVTVSPAVRLALLSRTGPQAPALVLAEAYERGDWATVHQLSETLGLALDDVGGLYVESIKWAERQLAGASLA